MRLIETVAQTREQIRAWRGNGERIALVPTMGNLHAGHFALVEIARRHADRVIATVFVNPTQFGPQEDLARYPRDRWQPDVMLDCRRYRRLFAGRNSA